MTVVSTEKTSRPDGSAFDPSILVQRIQGGDAQAEEELVVRYGVGLRVMLVQLTRDPTLADDLYQETLALVLTKIRQGELRQPEALTGFLRAIARNLFIADRRKEARYSSLDDEPSTADLPSGTNRLTAEASPLRQALAAEEAQRVRQLLGELRYERDREILVCYYLSDVSKEEICRDLDVDSDLFNRVLYRARQRLRELWERSEKRLRLGGAERTGVLAMIFLVTWVVWPSLLLWRGEARGKIAHRGE